MFLPGTLKIVAGIKEDDVIHLWPDAYFLAHRVIMMAGHQGQDFFMAVQLQGIEDMGAAKYFA